MPIERCFVLLRPILIVLQTRHEMKDVNELLRFGDHFLSLSSQWLNDHADQRKNDEPRKKVFHIEICYVASLADFVRGFFDF